jgi:hypothetical protein
MHVAENSITNRAEGDYPKYEYSQRTGADSDVDVFRRSDSKDNYEGYSLGEKVSDDYDNLTIHDSDQVTRSRPNACCSSDGISDERESGRRGEEMKNYGVCTMGRLGRYEDGNDGDAKPATDAHNSIMDETAVTTDQLREMMNELENLTSNQKQKLADVLMKCQGNLIKTPGKCKGPYMISKVIPSSTYELSTTRGKIRGEFIERALSLALQKKTLMRKAENKVRVMQLGSLTFAT